MIRPLTRSSMRRAGALLATSLVLLVLSIPGAQALSLGGFKNSLVTFLLEKISVPGQFEVTADEVQSPENGFSVLKGVRVSDSRGVWFRAQELSFSWSASKLLTGEVQINAISIDHGDLQRLPQVEGAAPQAAPQAKQPFAWPRSPIALSIPKIAITAMHISAAVLAQAIRFDANGTLRDQGDEQSVTLLIKRVDDVAGSIDVSYLKRFDDDRLALNLAANEAAGGLVAKVAGLPADVPATLNVNGSGTPAKWEGTLDLNVEGMLAAKATLAANWLQRIGVKLHGTLAPGPRLAQAPRLAIGAAAGFDLQVQENDNGMIAIEQARLDSSSLQLTATGSFSRHDSVLDLAMDVAVDRDGAQRLAPMIDPLVFTQAKLRVTAKGPADAVVIAGRGELLAPAVAGFAARAADLVFEVPTADGTSATVNLTAASPSGPGPAYAKAFGASVAIELATRRSGDTLTLETARLSSAAVQASVSGHINTAAPLALDLAYTLNVPDLVPLASIAGFAASGALQASGVASGAVAELATSGKLRLSRAVVNGQGLGQVDIDHETRIAEHISGTARLKMNSADFGAGSASGAFRVRDGAVALNRLRVDLLSVEASGDLTLPPHARMPVGKLDFTVSSLEALGRLSGQQLAGRGRGHAQFVASRRGESTLQAQFTDVRINDLALQSLRVDGSASGLATPDPKLAVRLDAKDFSTSAGARLDEVTLTADGTLSALALNAKVAGAYDERPLRATLRALAALDKPVKSARVDTLQASFDSELIALRQPARLSVSAQGVQLEDLDLALPNDGRVHGWFRQLPAAVSVNLQLEQVPLRLLQVLAGVPVADGHLSGTVAGTTAREAPRLDARLAVSGVRAMKVPADTGALGAELIAAWDGRELRADMNISGPFEPAIKGHLRVPVALSAADKSGAAALPVFNPDAPLEARLDWRGEVEPVLALLPIPDHVVTGVATIALRVTGSLSTPLPSGELTLQDGRYENLLAGTIIENLVLKSDFSNQQRVQFSATGDDGHAGSVQVKGVVLPAEPDQLLDISARLEHMLLVRIDAATMLSSADLTIKSSAEALDVKGAVVVEKAEIRLLNPLPPSIVDLGEVRIAGQKADSEDARKREPVVPVRLDIGVEIPGQVFVRGRGLDSEWGGALHVSGTAAQPRIDGRIESRRGVLELLGRAFDLQRGWVVFSKKDKPDPNLDLRLVREANDITGSILIEGSGSKPSLRFTSNPALPMDEVLPRLLFGRSKQSLSGPEAVQLAAGLAALARGDEGVLDVARKALGVDVLRIESGKDGSDSAGNLSVGRYATEKIYVGAKQSLDGQSSSVVVEIQLPKNFVIDTEVGQNADGSVGITWRRDF